MLTSDTRREDLKALMEKHGISVKVVAWLLHVTHSCVYNWCNGHGRMPDRAWLQLQEKVPLPAPPPKPTGRILRLGDSWSVG